MTDNERSNFSVKQEADSTSFITTTTNVWVWSFSLCLCDVLRFHKTLTLCVNYSHLSHLEILENVCYTHNKPTHVYSKNALMLQQKYSDAFGIERLPAFRQYAAFVYMDTGFKSLVKIKLIYFFKVCKAVMFSSTWPRRLRVKTYQKSASTCCILTVWPHVCFDHALIRPTSNLSSLLDLHCSSCGWMGADACRQVFFCWRAAQ